MKNLLRLAAAIAIITATHTATAQGGYTDWSPRGTNILAANNYFTVPTKSDNTSTLNFERLGISRYNNQDFLITGSRTGNPVVTNRFPVNGTVPGTNYPAAADPLWTIPTSWTLGGAPATSNVNGIAPALDGGYYVTCNGTAGNITVKVLVSGTTDTLWANNGTYSHGTGNYGHTDTLPDGRLVLCPISGVSTGMLVLNADGSGAAGNITGVASLMRAMCIKDSSTAFILSNGFTDLRKITFDPVNFGAVTSNVSFATIPASSGSGVEYNVADNTVIVAAYIATGTTGSIIVYDADTGAVKQTLTTAGTTRQFCTPIVTSDGANGQIMYVSESSTRRINVFYRTTVCTVPVGNSVQQFGVGAGRMVGFDFTGVTGTGSVNAASTALVLNGTDTPAYFKTPGQLAAEKFTVATTATGWTSCNLTFPLKDTPSVAIDTAFRFNGTTFVGKYPATLSGKTVTVNGVTGFSDWYFGSSAAVPVTLSGLEVE